MVEIKGGEKALAMLAAMATSASRSREVAVGFPEGSTHVDKNGNTISMPLLAALNEFGVPSHNQPPRPFMRNTVAKHSAEWTPAAAALLKANGGKIDETLDQVGQAIAGQMTKEIATFTSPPNAPSTIAQKGFDSPLRDTGVMAQSISVNVRDAT